MIHTSLSPSPRALLASLVCLLAAAPALAAPTFVSAPGSYQDKAGCSGAWDPACSATQLTYDATDDVWQGTFTVSAAGDYQFKAALEKSWDVNYGARGVKGGDNVSFHLAAAGPVKFYYDDKTHWITNNKSATIATVIGDFQHLIGCSGDSQPDCLRSWLQDVDGDGVYDGIYHLPPGTYSAKVAIDEGTTETYGTGGQLNGPAYSFTIPAQPAAGKDVLMRYTASTHELLIVVGPNKGNLGLSRAHFVSRDTIAWNIDVTADTQVKLYADPNGGVTLSPSAFTTSASTTVIPLTYDPAGLSADLKAKFPHLANYKAFKLGAGNTNLPDLLKGQLAVVATQLGDIVDATSLQIPGVLDDLYTYNGALGVTWSDGVPTLRVWAPTARSVGLRLYDTSESSNTGTLVPMTADGATGTWVAAGQASWKNKFYLYEVEVYVRSTNSVVKNLVTDPYSISLSTNSKRSQIVDLNDPSLKPNGWDDVKKPDLAAPEDIVLYELHVRDFSNTDWTVPESHRGKFIAFTDFDSAGMKHLKRLATAGLTHVHILPAFDIASIDEDAAARQEPKGDLSTFAPDSDKQRQAVTAVADQDSFNWGYDPYHFGVPEGSYSTDPNGPARIFEFRAMVQALNMSGLRVVMDVVYNHTKASGQADQSVLDKVVPGYYHRLNADGFVETSTCCQNTASEHAMMEKLMVDTLKIWATAYRVDGFRFDLMGHHMKSNMIKVRDTLAALKKDTDGVDGSKIYLYGEGWNFGEVANNARGEQATQANMAGTGIGTFTDRLRDAVRGGSPFSAKTDQGFITGMFTAPNEANHSVLPEQLKQLQHATDLILAGLGANLKDFLFTDTAGQSVKGSDVKYNGEAAGYAADPQETINYVSAHDNETLFDAIQEKLPVGTEMDDRLRVNNLGVSLVMLAQGIPFFHAGDEILRSKSGDPNSYNSGDWFNRIDWSYKTNNWGVGLPPGGDDTLLKPLLANPALVPSQAHILRALDHFTEMLAIRKSSILFRQQTGDDVKRTVKFLNTGANGTPGLVVMTIDNPGKVPTANDYDQAVVLFNATTSDQTFTAEDMKEKKFVLHPALQKSSDYVVASSSFDAATGSFKVPARTTAVFVTGAKATGGCGCGQASGTGLGALGLLLASAFLVMRRRAVR